MNIVLKDCEPLKFVFDIFFFLASLFQHRSGRHTKVIYSAADHICNQKRLAKD